MFGKTSKDRLETCTDNIQKVMNRAVKIYDMSVVWGHRGREAQNKAFMSGNSKKQWPDSKHNKIPSRAIDVIPYPSGWPQKNSKDYRKQVAAFYHMAGVVLAVADMMGVKLRWGGDWDMDDDFSDNTFDDLAHFEEIE